MAPAAARRRAVQRQRPRRRRGACRRQHEQQKRCHHTSGKSRHVCAVQGPRERAQRKQGRCVTLDLISSPEGCVGTCFQRAPFVSAGDTGGDMIAEIYENASTTTSLGISTVLMVEVSRARAMIAARPP